MVEATDDGIDADPPEPDSVWYDAIVQDRFTVTSASEETVEMRYHDADHGVQRHTSPTELFWGVADEGHIERVD